MFLITFFTQKTCFKVFRKSSIEIQSTTRHWIPWIIFHIGGLWRYGAVHCTGNGNDALYSLVSNTRPINSDLCLWQETMSRHVACTHRCVFTSWLCERNGWQTPPLKILGVSNFRNGWHHEDTWGLQLHSFVPRTLTDPVVSVLLQQKGGGWGG